MASAHELLREAAERRYREMTPESAKLHEQARETMPGGDTRNITFFRPYPLFIDRGEGAYLDDVDGNRYLDCTMNITAVILGHGHPAVVDAVTEQVAKGTAWAAANRWAPELAELLTERIPSMERVRFVNSGTEAVMLAVRAARAFTGRRKVAKAFGSYHGSHDEFEVSGGEAPRGIMPGAAEGIVEFEYNDPQSVTRLLDEHGDDVAAVIIDPAFMNGGFLPPSDGFLQHLRDETSRHGALLIFDEVVSLRIGLGGAQEVYGVTPDLTAMGKMIGGGFPAGAFGGREEIMEQYSPLRDDYLHHSGTSNGNPISMIAGLAALRQLDADTISYVNRLGDRLAAGVTNVARERGVSLHVTGYGSLRNLHLTEHAPTTVAESQAGRRGLVHLLALRLLTDGVLCGKNGLVTFSTVTSEADADGVIERIGHALDWLRPAIEEEAPELLASSRCPALSARLYDALY